MFIAEIIFISQLLESCSQYASSLRLQIPSLKDQHTQSSYPSHTDSQSDAESASSSAIPPDSPTSLTNSRPQMSSHLLNFQLFSVPFMDIILIFSSKKFLIFVFAASSCFLMFLDSCSRNSDNVFLPASHFDLK